MSLLYNPSADIKTIIVSDRSYKIRQLEDSPSPSTDLEEDWVIQVLRDNMQSITKLSRSYQERTLQGFGGGLGHIGNS